MKVRSSSTAPSLSKKIWSSSWTILLLATLVLIVDNTSTHAEVAVAASAPTDDDVVAAVNITAIQEMSLQYNESVIEEDDIKKSSSSSASLPGWFKMLMGDEVLEKAEAAAAATRGSDVFGSASSNGGQLVDNVITTATNAAATSGPQLFGIAGWKLQIIVGGVAFVAGFLGNNDDGNNGSGGGY